MKRFFKAVGYCMIGTFLANGSMAAEVDSYDHEMSFEDLKVRLLDRYDDLIVKIAGAEQATMLAIDMETSNDSEEVNLVSWWHEDATAPLSGLNQYAETDIPGLYATTLDNSSQIKVFSYLPLIRKTTIQEAEGEFDTRLYANGTYSSIDEPVGDELRTGGPDRYLEDSGGIAVGLERKFLPGTTVAIEQEFESFDSNSEFLNPIEQGHSTTSLTLTQPLLKGFGPDYNRAKEELAKVDYESASSELKRQIDSHLLEITRSYWGLYLERSVFLQKHRLAEKSKDIVSKMEQRKDIDVEPSLLARAKSQMFAHQLAADEAQFAILNAQSRLWTLTNAPELVHEEGLEFVTAQQPQHDLPLEDMRDILQAALANRPEINQSIQQIQSALLRHYRSRNELLPELDLFAQTYVKGLEGDYDHSEAFDESWSEGDPSYSLGLRFDFPIANNAAEARELRKKLEIKQLINQLDTTVTNILFETQISFRELVKYNMAMQRRYSVLQSTNEEINSLVSRIDYLISKNEEYGSILNRLMDAIERLNRAEMEFSNSELTYNLALYQLKSAKGTLIDESGVLIEETEEDDLPINKIEISSIDQREGRIQIRDSEQFAKLKSSSVDMISSLASDNLLEPVSTLIWTHEFLEQQIQ